MFATLTWFTQQSWHKRGSWSSFATASPPLLSAFAFASALALGSAFISLRSRDMPSGLRKQLCDGNSQLSLK
jgi:hypothetical protein